MARNDMMYDGRRMPPRNSRGEFTSRGRGRGRGRRGDRGMDYGMYPEMRDGRVIRSYPNTYPQGDYTGDMNYDMARGDSRGDMRGGDYRGDMHHGGMGRGGYEPVEFMGYCSGYYGAPQDYGRGRDYGYPDMRGGRRDYGYDYGYDYGDYGETLSEKELEHWNKKLMSQLDEREKQMFSKEAVIQRAKSMGAKMEEFGENELYTTCLMIFSDYKRSIGANLDLTIKLALDWLNDQDSAVKGAEKLAIYHDEVIMGGDD